MHIGVVDGRTCYIFPSGRSNYGLPLAFVAVTATPPLLDTRMGHTCQARACAPSVRRNAARCGAFVLDGDATGAEKARGGR